MKAGRALVAAALSLRLIFSLTGCSGGKNWKDSILDGFNDLLHHFSKYTLTNEKALQGSKADGEGSYTGSYTAEYDGFNGTE